MPQRMDDQGFGMGAAAGGCSIVAIGTVLLVASLFLDRADDYFYEVADNSLIGYGATGPALAGLIGLVILFSALSLTGPIPRLASLALVLVSVACLTLAILAGLDLGEHRTEGGYAPNETGGGTVLSLAASGLMLWGSLVAFGATGGKASINSAA